MKKMLRGLIAGMIFMLPMSAMALDLEDYVEPDLFYQDAEVEAMFNIHDGNQEKANFNGNATIFYDMEYSTLPMTYRGFADGTTNFSRGSGQNDHTSKYFEINAGFGVNKYLKKEEPRKMFMFGDIDFSYIDDNDDSNNNDDPYAMVTAGVGYGRIFTATPLMETVRIVEDLRKYGIIQNDVTDATYMKLAHIINKENEYKSKYSLREYEKYWYEAMEQVLKESGNLSGPGLGAMGLIRIQDILQDEKVIRRKHGWEAKAGLGYLISDRSGNDSDPVVHASFEYAKPVGFKWQFIDTLSYNSILVDWEFGDSNHEFKNEAHLDYEISNRIDWLNMWELAYTAVTEDGVDDIVRNAVETGFRFYINNTVDFETKLRFDHYDQGDNKDDDIETTLYMGVVYTIF